MDLPPHPPPAGVAAPWAARALPAGVLGAAAAALALAGAAPDGVPPARASAALAVVAGVALIPALVARRARASAVLLVVLALVSALAWGAARVETTGPAAPPEPSWITTHVVVETPAVPAAGGGWRFRARVLASPHGPEGPAGMRLLMDVTARDPPVVGVHLRVAGRLRPAAGADSPAWWRRWLERQGIAGRLRAARAEPIGRRGGAAGLRDRWRNWAAASAGAGLTGDTHAVVRGLALGGGSLLTEATATDFRESGMWHLLAVSGQNVTLVALAVLVLLRLLGLRGVAAPLVAAGVVVAYCLACDGGASVARAGTMGVLALVAELRSVARMRWTLLLGGMVGLLAWQPRAVWDPGLQLSFAAVGGLFGLAPRIQRGLSPRLPERAAALVAMALAAGLATAPVLAANFGTISPAGLAVNLVAVPLAGPVVVLALVGVTGAALHPWAAEGPAALAGLGADLLRAVARAGASPEWATVAVPRWSVVPLALLASAPLLPDVARRLGLGTVARRPGARRATATASLAAVALAALLWPVRTPAPWPPAPALTALDVGQGDALLLRGPGGESLMVDAGPPARGGGRPPVLGALGRHGVTRLDALLITHGDADHAGGAAAVLEHIPVGALLAPPAPADGEGEAMGAALLAASREGVHLRRLVAGAALSAGPWRARVLHPRAPLPRGGSPNDASLVLHAAAGPLSVLLTGDAEGRALAGAPLRRAAVLKVSHHGSADPLLAAVLERVDPRVAVISVGAGNPFGHPHRSVLSGLADARVPVLRTDLAGDITLAADPSGAVPALIGR